MAERPAMHARAKIGEKGRVVIPADMRDKLGLKAGDIVEVTMVDGELRISSFQRRLEEIQKRMAKYGTPGKLWSEELIAERREEAKREEDEVQKYLQASEKKRKLRVG